MGRHKTVVCDVDGTVALRDGRGPFDYHLVETDLPNTDVIEVVQDLATVGHRIVFLSGRENVDYETNEDYRRHGKTGTCHQATERWLRKHTSIDAFELHLRSEGDRRPDHAIKAELYRSHLAGRDILCVFDDRDQVVELWRNRLGLTCLQVAYGNF